VSPTGVGSNAAVGVAAHDAASGTEVTVWPLAGVTHEVTASAAIAVGDNVVSAANGQVASAGAIAAGTTNDAAILGVASTAAGAGGVKIQMVGR
jgi:hypothetical protein